MCVFVDELFGGSGRGVQTQHRAVARVFTGFGDRKLLHVLSRHILMLASVPRTHQVLRQRFEFPTTSLRALGTFRSSVFGACTREEMLLSILGQG